MTKTAHETELINYWRASLELRRMKRAVAAGVADTDGVMADSAAEIEAIVAWTDWPRLRCASVAALQVAHPDLESAARA